MPFAGLFEWMDALESSVALRQSINAYPFLLTLHLISMAAFAGLIGFWDMRLVGIALKTVPVSKITERIFPWMIAAFVVTLITGFLLAYSKPLTYHENFYFWVKNALMILAGINAGVFHLTTEQTVAQWENDPVTPRGAKIAGIASLAMWAVIIMTGRMIAYSALVPEWWVALNAAE
jgi:hypothetical protein